MASAAAEWRSGPIFFEGRFKGSEAIIKKQFFHLWSSLTYSTADADTGDKGSAHTLVRLHTLARPHILARKNVFALTHADTQAHTHTDKYCKNFGQLSIR